MQKNYAAKTRVKFTWGAGLSGRPKSDATITGQEIAELLNMKYATFCRRRQQLMLYGMPRPIPGANLVWSRTNVLNWINRDGGTMHALPGASRDPVEIARDELEQRMGGRS